MGKKDAEFAFGISMLGKDITANHEITFLDTGEFGVFDIKWKGKVANTNLGEKTFDYDFYVYMKNIKFGGVNIHPGLDHNEVNEFLKNNIADFENFDLLDTEEFDLNDYVLKLKAK